MRPRTLRLPERLEADLNREFQLRGTREWSAGVVELLSEAVRMRRVPGIMFTDGMRGRRAVLAGTGIEVWEIAAMWLSQGRDAEALQAAYHWLTAAQLRTAIAYYEAYPAEIDERLALEERWTPEAIRDELASLPLGPGITGHE